jgi:hypothetical protein
MTDYEKLKTELSEISSILEKFPDELKSKVFDILVQSFTGNLDFSIKDNPEASKNVAPEQKKVETSTQNGDKEKEKKQTPPRKPSSESYSIDRDLNLRGNNDVPSFKDFYEKKKPESKAEFNALSIYYLKVLLKLEAVSLSQVYTCYKEVSYKPAEHFKQSFRDTKSQHGYIEFDDNWNLLIPHRGITFIEHDLPKQKKSK